jgi:hypothetical protein
MLSVWRPWYSGDDDQGGRCGSSQYAGAVSGELWAAAIAAVAALAGAGIGAWASYVSSKDARLSAERVAAFQRDLSARELAARAFARARAAVSSLHPSLVRNVADFIPLSDAAEEHIQKRRIEIREALAELDQVSALLAGTETGARRQPSLGTWWSSTMLGARCGTCPLARARWLTAPWQLTHLLCERSSMRGRSCWATRKQPCSSRPELGSTVYSGPWRRL